MIMYPYVIFILIIAFFKVSYATVIVAYILKSICYYFGLAFIGNAFCFSVFIEGAILDGYFNTRNYYYGQSGWMLYYQILAFVFPCIWMLALIKGFLVYTYLYSSIVFVFWEAIIAGSLILTYVIFSRISLGEKIT
jgi:hypothetical protein